MAWQAKKLIPDVTMCLRHARVCRADRQAVGSTPHAHARSEPPSIINLGRCGASASASSLQRQKTRTNRWSLARALLVSGRRSHLFLPPSPQLSVKGPPGDLPIRNTPAAYYPRAWDGCVLVGVLHLMLVSTPGVMDSTQYNDGIHAAC
jgi:hypothetical protein